MTFNSESLKSRLEKLDQRSQVFFALLCAERLRGCCWALQQRFSDLDYSPYFDGCELMFRSVQEFERTDLTKIRELAGALEAIIPRSDEFGFALGVQAQGGLLALLDTCQARMAPDVEAVVHAAQCTVDACDNYFFFIKNQILGDRESPPSNHPLLLREIERQEGDVSLLAELQATWGDEIARHRVRNLQYAIPIAV